MTKDAIIRMVDEYAAADKAEKESKGAKDALKPAIVEEAESAKGDSQSVSIQGTANKIQVQWPEKLSVDMHTPEAATLAEPAIALGLRGVVDGIGAITVDIGDLVMATEALKKSGVTFKPDINWKVDAERFKALRDQKFEGLDKRAAEALRKAVKIESSPRLVVK